MTEPTRQIPDTLADPILRRRLTTDDMVLTRGWEEVAYENPFSRRIIGNTLIGYFLFQGWGNNPCTSCKRRRGAFSL